MIVNSVTLKNFRNYQSCSYQFKPKINVVIGENGVGKTNIMEAIYYLSLARSFRGVDDIELIHHGEEFAYIDTSVNIGDIKRRIQITISKNGKRILVNGKAINRISELAKTINVILFEPKDVMLFRGSPKDRRDFLNIALSKKSELYLEQITRYEKILRERNEALKSVNPDLTLIETTTEMLVKLAGPIVSYRQVYVKDINDILNKIARALTGVQGKIEIVYQPFVKYDEHFENNAKEAFKKALESDLKHKATSIGVHREDFSVNLNGKDIATYGSQGENRMVALALKLSPYFLETNKDKRPVVVLDDVMSELDSKHQERLIKFLNKFEQVFITATKLKIDGANHYEIKNKEVL